LIKSGFELTAGTSNKKEVGELNWMRESRTFLILGIALK
jgi:hypothetical protein